MVSLQDFLDNNLGVDLTGWTLSLATDVSGDGTVIVGTGINPSGRLEGWIATIPEPSTLILAILGLLALLGWDWRRKHYQLRHNSIASLVALGAALGLGSTKAEATVMFDDGAVHDVDYVIVPSIEIRDSDLGEPTTVQLVGGELGLGAELYGGSRLDVSAGLVTRRLWAYDDSHVVIDGGRIECHPGPYGRSSWLISGGIISGNLHPHDDSVVEIVGGEIGSLNSWMNSSVVFNGGSVAEVFTVHGRSRLSFSGGAVACNVSSWDQAVVEIAGGVLGDGVTAAKESRMTISGGEITGDIVAGYHTSLVYDASTIVLVGTEFEVNGVPIGYCTLESSQHASGRIAGSLLSGHRLDTDFFIYDGASIVLIPEPSTLILLCMGVVGLLACGWRRKR